MPTLKKIIVVGASSGGLEPLLRMVRSLPQNLEAAIFIVWHMASDAKGLLPELFNREGWANASNAIDNEVIEPGHIYVAPPDHHMLIEQASVRIVKGPKENRFRPAIDPLFRSAAMAYGANVMGIILSGRLDDGTSGLWLIKYLGGATVIQNPEEAQAPSMPQSALKEVEIDYILPMQEMPEAIMHFLDNVSPPTPVIAQETTERLNNELAVMFKSDPNTILPRNFGEATRFTCPDCGGTLSAIKEGKRIRYRCHTGHAYSGQGLMNGINDKIEDGLWAAIRAAEERIMLLEETAQYFERLEDSVTAATYRDKMRSEAAWLEPVRSAVRSIDNNL